MQNVENTYARNSGTSIATVKFEPMLIKYTLSTLIRAFYFFKLRQM